jgi:EAL domain-containing protein (putative c-di-GMP-specific phosphodiesterase class I)
MEDIRQAIAQTEDRSPDEVIRRALTTVRKHLGMDVAYLSEFVDGQSVFRAVDAAATPAPVNPGDSISLDDVYCRHIIEGRLPRLIPDTASEPLAVSLPITQAVPIGSHVSVPIRREDGSVYGMFCCLSKRANPSLNDRDLEVMETFAHLSGEQVNTALRSQVRRETLTATIRDVLAAQRYNIVLQPIFALADGKLSGFEALCRFQSEPYRSPDKWFADAAEIGLMIDLEVAVMKTALDHLADLPDHVYIGVNASPETVASGRLAEAFAGRPLERIVLEVTEHVAVDDYDALVAEIRKWRYRGVTLAIDDAGAGYSGLQHIVRLAPDILKLDMSLTTGIDTDPARRALAAALVHFAEESRSVIVAEGIETDAEFATLSGLGVHRGQGWLLGKPAPLDAARSLCASPRWPGRVSA